MVHHPRWRHDRQRIGVRLHHRSSKRHIIPQTPIQEGTRQSRKSIAWGRVSLLTYPNLTCWKKTVESATKADTAVKRMGSGRFMVYCAMRYLYQT